MIEIPEGILEQYRYINVAYDDWWEPVWETERCELKEIGFEAEDFRFTGFTSQGDGASFVGDVVDFDKFWKAFDPEEKKFPMLRKTTVLISLRRHSHEKTVYVEIDYEGWNLSWNEDDPFKEELYRVWNNQLIREAGHLELVLREYMYERMRNLYRKLEEHYDFLTSDEQVADWIKRKVSAVDSLSTVTSGAMKWLVVP